ncbi:hypothetical protein M8J75_007341 [Diaphorina citri]|nr:hypothetical protein M8J75_007341 [Diaphorina citri]
MQVRKDSTSSATSSASQNSTLVTHDASHISDTQEINTQETLLSLKHSLIEKIMEKERKIWEQEKYIEELKTRIRELEESGNSGLTPQEGSSPHEELEEQKTLVSSLLTTVRTLEAALNAREDEAPGANTSKASPSKANTSKASTSKASPSKAGTSKASTSKASTSKAGTSKASTSKANTSKASTSKASTSKASPSKASTSKASPSKASTSKAGTSKASTSKASTSKAGTSKASTSKASTSRIYSSKMIVVGDSHVRQLQGILAPKISPHSVQCIFRGGTKLGQVPDLLEESGCHLSPGDVLIVFSGTNDVSATSWGVLNATYQEILSKYHSCRIGIVLVPLRRGDHQLNDHISHLNQKILNSIGSKNVVILDPQTVLSNEDYCPDGLHLNKRGKGKMCDLFKRGFQFPSDSNAYKSRVRPKRKTKPSNTRLFPDIVNSSSHKSDRGLALSQTYYNSHYYQPRYSHSNYDPRWGESQYDYNYDYVDDRYDYYQCDDRNFYSPCVDWYSSNAGGYLLPQNKFPWGPSYYSRGNKSRGSHLSGNSNARRGPERSSPANRANQRGLNGFF